MTHTLCDENIPKGEKIFHREGRYSIILSNSILLTKEQEWMMGQLVEKSEPCRDMFSIRRETVQRTDTVYIVVVSLWSMDKLV